MSFRGFLTAALATALAGAPAEVRAEGLFSLESARLAGQPDAPREADPEPASPPVSSFFKEFVKNFGRLVSRRNFVPAFIGTVATATASYADDDLAAFFAEERRLPWLGDGGDVVGQAYVAGAVSVGLLFLTKDGEDRRLQRMAYSLCQGIAVTQVLVSAIKVSTDRTRPNGTDDFSFPSGHAATAFTWATVVGHYYGKGWGAASYGVAGLMALSRLEKNKHFLSDVVAGAFIGYIVATTVSRGTDSWAERHGLAVSPFRHGDAKGVAVSLRF